jgi:phospholipid transport system substrate-binding protein
MRSVALAWYEGFSGFLAMARRLSLAAVAFLAIAAAAAAAPPAEQYVNDNVQKAMTILGNKALTRDQRRDQFQDFLTGLFDLKRVADYTLGQYRRGAQPGDLAAFEAAYKEYALTVYQVNFNKFSGLVLQVTGSYTLSGDESVVKTTMADPDKKTLKKPMAVNFRVASQGGKFLVTDIAVEGVWLRQTQRDDFTAYLGQNGGNMQSLIGVLKTKTKDELAHSK